MIYLNGKTSSGFIINKNQIMTNAHCVAYDSRILVSKHGDTEKYAAKVVAKAHECDLALLEVEEPQFWENTEALKFDGVPELHEPVVVLGYPTGGSNLSVTAGVVSRLDVRPYAHSNIDLLCVQIDAAINPGNSGGPALNSNSDVSGVAFQAYGEAQNIGYIIPSTVIQRFLTDISRNNSYTGLVFLNCQYQNLTNEALKKFYNLHKIRRNALPNHITPTGVLVTDVPQNFNGLKPNDVILALDNTDIASDGTIQFRSQERVSGSQITLDYFRNDIIQALVWRDNQLMNIPVILEPKKSLIPYHQWDMKPRYFIYGGLVFCPFSVEWLRDQYGEGFAQVAPYEMLKYLTHNKFPGKKEEIVVLSQILPTKLTNGYQFDSAFVKSVNGEKLNSLNHLVQCLEKSRDEKFTRFELNDKSKIILDNAATRDSNEHIKEKYTIPSLWSREYEKQAQNIFK